MKNPANTLPLAADEASPHDRGSLLAEVDFKWLMAGQGWWIDTSRFQTDPSHAAMFLKLAMASHSQALRQCAAILQAQMMGASPCEVYPLEADATQLGA